MRVGVVTVTCEVIMKLRSVVQMYQLLDLCHQIIADASIRGEPLTIAELNSQIYRIIRQVNELMTQENIK